MPGTGDGVLDAVIVGAGVAGLTAAVALAEEGLRVAVLERDPTLGGRARTVVDSHTGDPLPIGPHVFLADYANLRALLARLGTEDRVVWQQEPHLTVTDGARSYRGRLDLAPPPLHFVPVLARLRDLTLRDALASLPALLLAMQIDEGDVARLDDLDAARVLRWLGASEPSLEVLWSFVSRNVLNLPLEECSAGAFFRFCRFLLSRRTPSFGFADRGLGDVFAPAARRVVERAGGQVRTGVKVLAIASESGGASTVATTLGPLRARAVVVATPADAVPELLPPQALALQPELSGLLGFQPVPYASVFLWFDTKLTCRRFWARSFKPDDIGSDFYDLSNIYRGYTERPSLIATNVIGRDRLDGRSDAALLEGVRAELAELFPAATQTSVRHVHVERIPMAIHAPRPGTEKLRPPARTAVPGLVLAGDWTRTDLPACMESAALSGWRAAECVLERLGRRRALVQPLPAPAAIPALTSLLAHRLPIEPVDALLRARPLLERIAPARRSGAGVPVEP
jgi:squalene-associated FAD-dependent desaturase